MSTNWGAACGCLYHGRSGVMSLIYVVYKDGGLWSALKEITVYRLLPLNVFKVGKGGHCTDY